MSTRAIVVLLLSVIPAGLIAQEIELSVSGSAGENTKPEANAEVETTADTQNVDTTAEPSAPMSFDDKLEYGNSLYMKGDYQGALGIYNEARQMKSTDPLVLYFIACAETKLGNLDEAITALAAAKTMSGEKIASLTARILFMTAMVEEMRPSQENATAAWQAYKDFVTVHGNIPEFPQSADSRLSVLEKKKAQYTQYEIVRQRISTTK